MNIADEDIELDRPDAQEAWGEITGLNLSAAVPAYVKSETSLRDAEAAYNEARRAGAAAEERKRQADAARQATVARDAALERLQQPLADYVARTVLPGIVWGYDAEAVAAEAISKLWQAVAAGPRKRDEVHWTRWLLKVARNRAIDLHRKVGGVHAAPIEKAVRVDASQLARVVADPGNVSSAAREEEAERQQALEEWRHRLKEALDAAHEVVCMSRLDQPNAKRQVFEMRRLGRGASYDDVRNAVSEFQDASDNVIDAHSARYHKALALALGSDRMGEEHRSVLAELLRLTGRTTTPAGASMSVAGPPGRMRRKGEDPS